MDTAGDRTKSTRGFERVLLLVRFMEIYRQP